MKVTIKSEIGATLITQDMAQKVFSTGSRGYNGNFKVTFNGKKYQVNVNAVEIGSKPK